MIPYFIFIFFLLLCYWSKKPLWMLVILIVFALLRYDTGWDYGTYVHIVETPAFWNDGDTSRFSLAWRALFGLANRVNCPPLAIAVANILTYVVLYIALSLLKLSKTQKIQAILVYALWYDFYLSSFSTLRQALSMAIGVLMFALIQRKQLVWSLLAFFVAIHLHTSAIILVILYPIYLLRDKLNFKWLCISVITMCCVLSAIAEILMSLSDFGLDKYGIYLTWQDNFGGKLIYLNITLAVYFVFILYRDRHISSMERQCYFMVLSGVIGGIVIHYFGVSSVFARMLSYVTIFMILILFQSLNIFKEKRILRFVMDCLLILMFVGYLTLISKGGGNQLSPYVPYKCIVKF